MELIASKVCEDYSPICDEWQPHDCGKCYANNTRIAYIAEYLIANGVTVQELALPEEDYYVLRNTETGMYFRGKGVNRWGKHFNQATIYRVKGTAEFSMKEIAWQGEKAELVRIKIVEMPLPQPPKGEEHNE